MYQNNQPDELSTLESKVASQSDSIEAIRELADAYADQDRWNDAIEKYQVAIGLDSINSDLHNSLGIACEEVGRLEEAERAYQQAIALNAKDPMPYYNLGIMYEKQQRIPEAVQAYKNCLQYSADPSERSEVKKKIIGLTSETSTGQSRLAYRLAAVVLCLGILLNIISIPMGGGATIIVSSAIDLILAIGLLRLKAGARNFVFFRAFVGAIVIPLFTFFIYTNGDLIATLLSSLIQWGYCGALILLLTGQSKTWRLILAAGIFVVFTLGISALFLLLIVLAKVAGMQ